jgi:hypothetical protein
LTKRATIQKLALVLAVIAATLSTLPCESLIFIPRLQNDVQALDGQLFRYNDNPHRVYSRISRPRRPCNLFSSEGGDMHSLVNRSDINPMSPLSSPLGSSIKKAPPSRRRPPTLTIVPALIASLLIITPPLSARAGEVGARITKAVTTSDLGISVRQSVVSGAQIMDKIDGQWERFSDYLGLGAERSKQAARPTPKIIPEIKPLNVEAARQMLEISDQAFLQAYPDGSMTSNKLQQEIENVAQMVKVSFERSGVTFLDPEHPLVFETGPQFNFAVYSHYKAYSSLLLNQQKQQQQNTKNLKPFAIIRSDFERLVGQALLEKWKLKDTLPASSSSSLTRALQQTDKLAATIQDLGLAALVDTSPPIESEDWQEFLDGDAPELNWNVAVDGDVTLNTQILLQEQGYRLYPNFVRFALKEIFENVLVDATAKSDKLSGMVPVKVSVMDYYFDTDYSSDPDKFQVKEVLLGVSLENE